MDSAITATTISLIFLAAVIVGLALFVNGIQLLCHRQVPRGITRLAIGLALLGVVAAIVVPSFVKARNTSSSNSCINNIRMRDSGKEQAALAERWSDETDCDDPTNKAVVNQYIKGNRVPLCPEGGTYSYNKASKNPTCSKDKEEKGAVHRHRLPVSDSGEYENPYNGDKMIEPTQPTNAAQDREDTE
jgi:hypothetical protein